MCSYQGYEFGGGYLDSVCIDGYLWDADSGDADPSGEGWIYTSGGDIPCPICNPDEAIEYYSREDDDESRAAAISLVNDIRKNRGIAAVSALAAVKPESSEGK